MVSFDINQAGQANAPNISTALPSEDLPKAAIFGALHDMYFLYQMIPKLIIL